VPDRRHLLLAGLLAGAAGVGGVKLLRWSPEPRGELPVPEPAIVKKVGAMPYRKFGRTDLVVSELAFGAWAIGGQAYGVVERSESLAALARAEELGCNVVDTAAVYGNSETVLGEFLAGRRSRWIISTKYSGQQAGMVATLESQLRALGTDHVDLYLIHWAPGRDEAALYEQLEQLRQAGKARYVGVSLSSREDILAVLRNPVVDGFMVTMNLLQPDPFLALRGEIAASGKGIIVRSALREGFLAGRFTRNTKFADPTDQRSRWSAQRIAETVDQVERFRFLAARSGSLARAAIAYPLSFPEVASVAVGVKTLSEAEENFGKAAGWRLTAAELSQVLELQSDLGLRQRITLRRRLRGSLRALLG
jgi:aryl-alcohol dehydrogenase-like predicted oxidoreductase